MSLEQSGLSNEKGVNGPRRPSQRRSMLAGLRKENELALLKQQSEEATTTEAAKVQAASLKSPKSKLKNIDRMHSNDSGHFRRYPSKPGEEKLRKVAESNGKWRNGK